MSSRKSSSYGSLYDPNKHRLNRSIEFSTVLENRQLKYYTEFIRAWHVYKITSAAQTNVENCLKSKEYQGVKGEKLRLAFDIYYGKFFKKCEKYANARKPIPSQGKFELDRLCINNCANRLQNDTAFADFVIRRAVKIEPALFENL